MYWHIHLFSYLNVIQSADVMAICLPDLSKDIHSAELTSIKFNYSQ